MLIRRASQIGAKHGPQEPSDEFWRKKIDEHLAPALSELTAAALEVGIDCVNHLVGKADETFIQIEDFRRNMRNDVLDFVANHVDGIVRTVPSKMGASGAAGRKGNRYSPMTKFVADHPYTRKRWEKRFALADLRKIEGVRIEEAGSYETVSLPGIEKRYRLGSVLDVLREDFQRRNPGIAKASGG